MIVRFPSLDVLRLALTSGAVPEAVRASAAQFGFDDDHSLWLESSAKLDDVSQKALRRLGVQFPRSSKIELAQVAGHWLQMLPLTRDPRPLDIGDKTPILFELTKPGQLAEVAGEILRLGNDRQSFRWLEDRDSTLALLRVIGPPYYSLLRAIDQQLPNPQATQEPARAPIAYREAAPRVWVQLGYRHPLAEHLRPPDGQLVLLRPPHVWTHLPEAKLHDIYEVFDFQLPATALTWHDNKLPAPINVPVRLTRSGAPDAAELWVLREDSIAQLEEFVRSSDNELLARLAFAVGETESGRVVVVRVRPAKTAPPVLVLDALACRSYLRIPNLFVPVGMALHPPLRRAAVVNLLAGDNTRVTWLMPAAGGAFIPQSLPDDAFRPLPEWIDYVLEHDHAAIKTWLAAAQFDFESFICKDDATKEKKPPKDPKSSGRGSKPPGTPGDEAARAPARRQEPKKPRNDATIEEEAQATPGELQKRLRELEESFSALTTPLDDPAREAIWHEMAELNGMLSQHADAAICWSVAMWERASVPVDWPRTWFRLEAKHAPGQTPPTAQVLGILKLEMPTHSSLRQLTAYLVWAAGNSLANVSSADPIRPHLSKVQRFLEKHESYLGVRNLWLAWHAIHRLAGGDVLTLVRARDRLLERLFLHGLTPELDLPGFLRFTGMQANTHFRMVRDQVVRLRRLVQDWAKLGTNPTPQTHAYIDLAFAFGLARLGETTEAVKLRDHAAQELQTADEVHSWLYEAFAFRIQQALDGKAAADRLPQNLLEKLEGITRPDFLRHIPEGNARDEASKTQGFLRYKIDRMREKSRLLEPHEKIDPFRYTRGRFDDELARELARLTDLTDRAELTQRLQKLLTGKAKLNSMVRIVIAALELAPRLGQTFGEETLDRATVQLAKTKDALERAVLLEKSLFLAGHYDRKEDVQRYVAELEAMLQAPRTLPFDKLIPVVAGSFRGLRKFGMRDQVAQLMQRLGAVVETDMSASNRAHRLCLMLELAAGWYYFGAETEARKILDEARDLLFRKELGYIPQTELASAYVTTLGQAPMDFALSRLMEFYRKVEGIYDNWTTLTHCSLSRYSVVEATLLALVSEDFTLDREARKRLDDDEYLVRRRIHRDVHTAMAEAESQALTSRDLEGAV